MTTKIINRTLPYNGRVYVRLSGSSPSSSDSSNNSHVCNVCGRAFLTKEDLTEHIDFEHMEKEHPEVF
jgi:hypothetical protein